MQNCVLFVQEMYMLYSNLLPVSDHTCGYIIFDNRCHFVKSTHILYSKTIYSAFQVHLLVLVLTLMHLAHGKAIKQKRSNANEKTSDNCPIQEECKFPDCVNVHIGSIQKDSESTTKDSPIQLPQDVRNRSTSPWDYRYCAYSDALKCFTYDVVTPQKPTQQLCIKYRVQELLNSSSKGAILQERGRFSGNQIGWQKMKTCPRAQRSLLVCSEHSCIYPTHQLHLLIEQ